MNNLYKNIRSRRLALGMTQDELARLTGYKDRSMIARIERGDVDLPQSKVVIFAKALRIPAGDLLGFEGTKEETDIERIVMYAQMLSTDGINKLKERAEELIQLEKYRKEGENVG